MERTMRFTSSSSSLNCWKYVYFQIFFIFFFICDNLQNWVPCWTLVLGPPHHWIRSPSQTRWQRNATYFSSRIINRIRGVNLFSIESKKGNCIYLKVDLRCIILNQYCVYESEHSVWLPKFHNSVRKLQKYLFCAIFQFEVRFDCMHLRLANMALSFCHTAHEIATTSTHFSRKITNQALKILDNLNSTTFLLRSMLKLTRYLAILSWKLTIWTARDFHRRLF